MQECAWWPRLFNLFARVAFTDFCDVGFRFARAFTFALRLVLRLVPTISSLVTVFSAISALSIESRVFNFRFSVTFPIVTLFAFLSSSLALRRIFLCLSLFGRGHQLPLDRLLECFQLSLS